MKEAGRERQRPLSTTAHGINVQWARAISVRQGRSRIMMPFPSLMADCASWSFWQMSAAIGGLLRMLEVWLTVYWQKANGMPLESRLIFTKTMPNWLKALVTSSSSFRSWYCCGRLARVSQPMSRQQIVLGETYLATNMQEEPAYMVCGSTLSRRSSW